MNWLDWTLLAIWALTAFYGFKQRATKMVAGLVILAVGLLLARPLAGLIKGQIGFVSDNDLAQTAAAYIILIVIAMIAAAALGWLMGRMVELFPMGSLLDRGVGLAIGLVAGLLFTGAILSGVVAVAPDAVDAFIQNAALGGFLVGPFNSALAGLGLALPGG